MRTSTAMTRAHAAEASQRPAVSTPVGVRPRPLQRKCRANDDKQCAQCSGGSAQRRVRDPADSAASSLDVDPVLSSAGRPLDEGTREFMEHRLGFDFGQVRVHSNGAAAESARAMNAVAYAVGHHLVFDAGEYAPHSQAGLQLIAHELTHVVQQAHGSVSGRASAGGLMQSEPGDAHERQADAVATNLFQADRSSLAQLGSTGALGAASAIQRQPRPGVNAQRARIPTLVEDGSAIQAGQMRRTDFLSAVHAAVSATVDAEFARIGRSARDCPYILRTIERYRGSPISALVRFVAAFARPAPGTSARGLVDAVAARAGVIARQIARREAPRAQAALEPSSTALPAHEPHTMRAQLGAGHPLDARTRDKMSRFYDTNFDRVRVHDDGSAAQFNAALSARAFTIGHDIAFASGQYRPGTSAGDRLIAHELAHTIQQSHNGALGVLGESRELEDQAERASAAVGNDTERAPAGLVSPVSGLRIQRAPVVLAGALIVAEATPEIIVVAEVASVTTEVVVVDGAFVVAADVAVPAALDVAAPVVLETVAPAAIETVAPAVASSSAYTSAATAVGIGAATTLSSDSSTSDDSDRRRRCQQEHPSALLCEEIGVDREEAAVNFLMNEGFDFDALGECTGVASFPIGAISACNGAPGERFHCSVRGSDVPLSIFGCLCCHADGNTGFEWLGPHWSDNQSSRGRR